MTGEAIGGTFSVTMMGQRLDRAIVGYCRDCRYWNKDEKYSALYPTDARVCRMGSGWLEKETPLFAATECCAYEPDVETMPDFGCVQFAAKEAE